MHNLTPEGLRLVSDVASRRGFSLEATLAMLDALARGNGQQAQFSHPEFGGMGQWSRGGMIMIGDMFNSGLKGRVDGLCNELAGLMQSQPLTGAEERSFQAQSQSHGAGVSLFVAGAPGSWWPAELGSPASAGAQNDLRYAYFPDARRLAIQQGGVVRVYDSGEHRIAGMSQQQSGDQSLTFTSQFGLVKVADLPLVSPRDQRFQAPAAPYPPEAPASASSGAPMASADIPGMIERLAELRRKDILTEEEFVSKKAELLGRI